jgi:hypothetical protein
MAFQAIAGYLAKLEDSPEDWHLSPVRGHSKVHKLFPFYPVDYATLDTLRITTVSQIFYTHLSGRIDKTTSPELLASLAPYPALQHKIQVFTRAFMHQPFHNKYACPQNPPCCPHESGYKPQSTLQTQMSRTTGLCH